MRLAIADPPYLGHAEFYGAPIRNVMNATGNIGRTFPADAHPDAHIWDDPETHRALVARLVDEYDGWAIALLPAHLRAYLEWCPDDTRVAVWHDPGVMPTGSHPRRRWEAVLIRVPPGWRKVTAVRHPVGDVFTQGHHKGRDYSRRSFAGRKPPGYTRWVLDMLGYNDELDTVVDLFAGSGAVAREVDQLLLPFGGEP